MLILKSRCTPSALVLRWDERTSPARFAGNDDLLDDIYIAHREDRQVFLIRKGRGTWDPFSTVFRGKIVSYEGGSAIKGHFCKRFFDYLVLALLLLLDIYFAYRGFAMERFSISTGIVSVLFGAGVILLGIPLPPVRKKYMIFLKEITDEDL